VPTRLIFVRHGESVHRLEGTLAGSRTCKGLTERGHAQARALAADLAVRAKEAAAVYASHVRRAQETAAPIAQALGLPLQTDEGLQTWDIPAELDSLTAEEGKRFAQPGGGTYRAFESVSETWSDLVVRVGKTLTRLAQKHPNQTVILVGHNETVMAGFIVLGNLALMPSFEAASSNGSLTIWQTGDDVMAFPGPRWVLHGFNIVPGG
jgi:probable phosphoglycerate mutase